MSYRGAAAQRTTAPGLVLKGIFVADNGHGLALISVAGQAAQLFPIGAQVISGYRVHSIRPQEVSLTSALDVPVNATLFLQQGTPVASPPPVASPYDAGLAAAAPSADLAVLSVSAAQRGADEPPPRLDSRYRQTGPSRHR